MLKDEIGDGGDDWTNGMNSDSDGCFFMTLPANKSGYFEGEGLAFDDVEYCHFVVGAGYKALSAEWLQIDDVSVIVGAKDVCEHVVSGIIMMDFSI